MASKVSVVMAVYRPCLTLLCEQIRSISYQQKRIDELIISLDGPALKQEESQIKNILNTKAFEVKFLVNEQNKGYSDNFRVAMSHASYDTIYYSDQDDVWSFAKVKRTADLLSPLKIDCVIHDCQIYCKNSDRFLGSKLETIRRNYLSQRPFVAGCCSVITRNIADLVSEKIFDYLEYDNQIHFLAQMLSKRKVVAESYLIYNRHDQNASSADAYIKNGADTHLSQRLRNLVIQQKCLFLAYSSPKNSFSLLRTIGRLKRLKNTIIFGPTYNFLILWVLLIYMHHKEKNNYVKNFKLLLAVLTYYMFSISKLCYRYKYSYFSGSFLEEKNLKVSRLDLPGFKKWSIGTYTILKKDFTAAMSFIELKKNIKDAIDTNQALVFLRISDGEMRYLLNPWRMSRHGGIKYKAKRVIEYYTKTLLNNYSISNTSYSGKSYVSRSMLKAAREEFWSTTRENDNIILCPHLSWSSESINHVGYMEPFLQDYFKKTYRSKANEIIPFYFIYALLSEGEIFKDKRVLVLCSKSEEERSNIENSLKAFGASKVSFSSVPLTDTLNHMFDIEDINNANNDIVLFGLGVHKLTLIRQLRHIKSVVIDAGYMLEVMADKSLSGSRPFCEIW